jgi:hypothetical protein
MSLSLSEARYHLSYLFFEVAMEWRNGPEGLEMSLLEDTGRRFLSEFAFGALAIVAVVEFVARSLLDLLVRVALYFAPECECLQNVEVYFTYAMNRWNLFTCGSSIVCLGHNFFREKLSFTDAFEPVIAFWDICCLRL